MCSSSDSDSDPEGGELVDLPLPQDAQVERKKLKKKRSERNIDERKQKALRKRQVCSSIIVRKSSLSIFSTNLLSNLLTLR